MLNIQSHTTPGCVAKATSGKCRALPVGGPFDLSTNVGAIVLAQLELMACCSEGREWRNLVAARKRTLLKLSDHDKGLMRALGAALVALAS